VIHAQSVTVSYRADEGQHVIVLNDVSLRVKNGELVTVVGPSGCGKSTMLRLILGSQFPTHGTVDVDGQRVQRVTRDCGIVYQNYSMFPHLTVTQNVMFGPILEKTGILERMAVLPLRPLNRLPAARPLLERLPYFRISRTALEEARELLSQCGLDPVRDGGKYPFELSGGMRQRVAIAQAIIMQPKILLMDEPFGALDQTTREEMQDFIHEQWTRHRLTVFFVTHDLEEACKVGTRLVCFSQYWTNDDGSGGSGAKIMIDRKIDGGEEVPSHFVHSEEFKSLVSDIRARALNRHCRQRCAEFDLSHPDALPALSAH
jgi:NitT/TauT family transport system ATP-binding protein